MFKQKQIPVNGDIIKRIRMLLRPKLILISFVVLFASFLFLVIVGSVFFMLRSNPESKKHESRGETYVSSIYDPSTRSVERDFVQLGRKIAVDESFSYFAPSGKYVLITPFGGDKFQCKGSCMCYDEKHDRRGSLALSNTLFFALTASSFALAVNYASKYFSDACQKDYSHMCSNIESNVEECSLKEPTTGTDSEKKKPPRWACTGLCARLNEMPKIIEKFGKSMQERDGMMKEKETIVKDIEVLTKKFREIDNAWDFDIVECENHSFRKSVKAYDMKEALNTFRTVYLNPFCQTIGEMPSILDADFGPQSTCYGDISKIMCVAANDN